MPTVGDQSCHVFQSLDVIGHGSRIQFPHSPQTLELCCPFVSSDKPVGHLTKVNTQKEGFNQQRARCSKEAESENTGSETWTECKESSGLSLLEKLEAGSQRSLAAMTYSHRWEKRKRRTMPQRCWHCKKLYMKGTQCYFTTLKVQRRKCWKLIQTYKKVWQFAKTQKRCSLRMIHYMMRRRQVLFKPCFMTFS